MHKKNSVDQYKEVNIRTASQGKLIVMLYDACIGELKAAALLLQESDKAQRVSSIDKINNNINKAQTIITELSTSLDLDNGGEIAQNLLNLYSYFSRRLVHANSSKTVEPIHEVLEHIKELKTAWESIQDKAPASNSGKIGVNIAG